MNPETAYFSKRLKTRIRRDDRKALRTSFFWVWRGISQKVEEFRKTFDRRGCSSDGQSGELTDVDVVISELENRAIGLRLAFDRQAWPIDERLEGLRNVNDALSAIEIELAKRSDIGAALAEKLDELKELNEELSRHEAELAARAEVAERDERELQVMDVRAGVSCRTPDDLGLDDTPKATASRRGTA